MITLLVDYIARDNIDVALAFVERLQLRINSLAMNPGLGRRRNEIAPDLRSIAEGKYLILYTCPGKQVEIVRVLHGAREIEKILREKT